MRRESQIVEFWETLHHTITATPSGSLMRNIAQVECTSDKPNQLPEDKVILLKTNLLTPQFNFFFYRSWVQLYLISWLPSFMMYAKNTSSINYTCITWIYCLFLLVLLNQKNVHTALRKIQRFFQLG